MVAPGSHQPGDQRLHLPYLLVDLGPPLVYLPKRVGAIIPVARHDLEPGRGHGAQSRIDEACRTELSRHDAQFAGFQRQQIA